MRARPFFSVVVPVYNVAPFLRVCLDSIVRAWETCAEASATPPDAECICIDDGSTDGSGAILDEYAERFGKGLVFRVFHQGNAGVGPARNRALDEARGDWILFVDSDDVVSPELFRYLHGALKGSSIDILKFGIDKKAAQTPPGEIPERSRQNPAATAGGPPERRDRGAFQAFSGGPGAVPAIIAKVPQEPHESQPIVYDVLAPENARVVARETIGALLLWNVCYRREVIGPVRVEPLQVGEDALFAATCLTRARYLAVTRTVLYVYVQRPGSCMHTMSACRVRDYIQAALRLNQVLHGWKMSAIMGRQIRKEFLGGYCGGVFKWVLRLPHAERRPMMEAYRETGRAICAIWCWPDPFAGGLALFFVRDHLPWRIKSALVELRWVKRIVLRARGVK